MAIAGQLCVQKNLKINNYRVIMIELVMQLKLLSNLCKNPKVLTSELSVTIPVELHDV